jgi:DNA-binding phage protein
MPLTRSFRVTIHARLQRDASFRKAVLQDALDTLFSGDVGVAIAVLRSFINGTLGFVKLGQLTGKSSKSLMRMFGPKGNPQANNLFEVLAVLQKRERLQLEVRAVKAAKRRPAVVTKRRPVASSRPSAVAAKRRAA